MSIEKSPPKHIIFVGAFILRDGKLLLGKRAKTEHHLPGYWAIPGGKVEISSDEWNILQQTAKTEALEETGVEIYDEMILFSNNSFTRTDGQPVVAINFLCTYKSGDAKPLEDTEEVRWVEKEELDDLKIESATKKQILLAHKSYMRTQI